MLPKYLPLVLTLLTPTLLGQGSAADYERAAELGSVSHGKVKNERIEVDWLDGGRSLYLVREDEDGVRRPRVVDLATGDERVLPSTDQLTAAVRALAGEDAVAGELMTVCDGEALFSWFGDPERAWLHDLDSAAATEVGLREVLGLRVEPVVGRVREGAGNRTVPLYVLNDLDATVVVEWLPRWGQPKEYGRIEPGGLFHQSTFEGHAWRVSLEDGTPVGGFVARDGRPLAIVDETSRAAAATPPPAKEADAVPAERELFVKDDDVWLRDRSTGEETRLTRDGEPEAGFDRRVTLAPGGRHAVVMHTIDAQTRRVSVVEAAPEDQLQPELHQWPYLKPGDRIAKRRPHLFDLEGGREVPVDDALFDNPWSISRLAWHPDGGSFHFVYDQRGHEVQRLVRVDAATGAVTVLADEAPKTFVDYSQKTHLARLEGVAEDGTPTLELLWASERDGWNHLYVIDANTGATRQMTRGEWVVREVVELHTEASPRTALLEVSGIFPDQDPYHLHVVRVDLDTGELTHLTRGDGTHRLDWSPDRRFYVDRWSRVDHAPVHELRRASDGALVTELARADWSELEATGWRAPERFVAKGRDGETDIWGIIRRPTTFDPARSYPVIEKIYAGPHGAHVPKDFRRVSPEAVLAELGFVVVQLDGMGTNHRGKRFHDVAWKNLGDAGFPDRRLWIEAAARHEPAMDLARVGIYGGSAGGQNALRAMLAHGDFYHAAAADCGCHDNRMDKIWWNEAWMGWPIGPHYEEQSNVTNAHELEGDLLLVVGEVDRNVDPASTMQVVKALIDADKDFELLVMPGVGHGAMDTRYGKRRMRDFFVRKLLGVEPRWE